MTLLRIFHEIVQALIREKHSIKYVLCSHIKVSTYNVVAKHANDQLWGRGFWFVYILIDLRINFSKHFENLFQNLEQIENNPGSFFSKNQKQQASNKDYWFLYDKSVADKLTFKFAVVGCALVVGRGTKWMSL